MLLPSADQIGRFPPPARGEALSPPTPEPTSQSKSAVKFLGWAPGAMSKTHRSGSVYERTGCDVDAVNANCFPLGLIDKVSAPISKLVSLAGSPPLTGIEYTSVVGRL